jgi:hypothetical protein
MDYDQVFGDCIVAKGFIFKNTGNGEYAKVEGVENVLKISFNNSKILGN